MKYKNKITRISFLLLAIAMVVGCQKMNRPALGNYPKDANPPGGPLKFYAALDGLGLDSIRANFATDNHVTFVNGVNGKAAKFDMATKGYISFPSANDFGGQTSFSVSIWINAGTTAQKDHVNADGILAFGNTVNFWGNLSIFADHETSTSDSMVLKVVYNNGGTNSNFIGYEGPTRIPHIYDGNWHHFVITYDAVSKTHTLYVDGNRFDQRVIGPEVFQNASVLVLGGFQQAANIQGTYNDNTWMSPFPGLIDQVRLYGKVLTQAEVTALFVGKL
jgi:hypothetical protein